MKHAFPTRRCSDLNGSGSVGGGAPVFAESMDWERALRGACHVGAMQRLLEGTVRHARTRKQFGQLIGKNQAVSHKIADMKVGLEAARWLIYRAAASLGASRDASLQDRKSTRLNSSH